MGVAQHSLAPGKYDSCGTPSVRPRYSVQVRLHGLSNFMAAKYVAAPKRSGLRACRNVRS